MEYPGYGSMFAFADWNKHGFVVSLMTMNQPHAIELLHGIQS